MEILGWSANLTDERCADLGVERAGSLDALLGRADVATIHLVLSERTRGLIGGAELARMKPSAVLVNTSRGPIVDDTALLAALRSGRPGCAAIDVYAGEPLAPDHPLRARDQIDAGKLLLTPHIGYVSRQTYELFYRQTVEAIEASAKGEPIREIRS
jgi:phosphoglycerate dehydrogenase-like enzyme